MRERDYILKIVSSILTDLLEEYDSGRFQTFWYVTLLNILYIEFNSYELDFEFINIFRIEKTSKAVQSRKRRNLHAEYVKFGNESTKLDMVVELCNYGIELVSVETGNTEMTVDDLKLRTDHTALKIELKDMIDDFHGRLHFKKENLSEIFVIGIQITGMYFW
jgi:hypothetical protein